MLKPTFYLFICLIAGASAEAPKTALGKEMKAFEQLHDAMRREKNPAEGARMARQTQQHLIESLAHTPQLLEETADGAEKNKAEAKYRRMIAQSLVLMCQIEEAYLANDLQAVSRLRSILLKLKEAGHDDFVDE